MTAAEIRDLTDDEIQERIGEVREELFRLRFRSATQELEDSALVGKLKKDLARLLTVLRMRELAQEER